jgi:hypothetical protein
VKNIKGIVAIAFSLLVGLLFFIALTGCEKKQLTSLQEWNAEKLRRAESGDLVICLTGNQLNQLTSAMIIQTNDHNAKFLYGFYVRRLAISHVREVVMYNDFRDCEVMVHKDREVKVNVIGNIILNGLSYNNPNEATKPASRGEEK